MGGRVALAAFGLPSQPSLSSVGVGIPKIPGAPSPGKPTSRLLSPPASPSGAKTAFNVGMGSSSETSGAGAQRGEPADQGRRVRSTIDRAFQRNEDDHATSSMPMPGAVVSP